MKNFFVDLIFSELSHLSNFTPAILQRMASLIAAFLAAKLSGHWGITIDPVKLTAGLFALFEYLRERINVKKTLPLLALMILSSNARAAINGRLDLDASDISPMALRDFTNGIWTTGAEKPIYKISTEKGVIFSLDAYAATDMSRANPTAGFLLSLPIGKMGDLLSQIFLLGTPTLTERARSISPNWLARASNFVSIDIGGGYDFVRSAAYIKPWSAVLGGRVQIPFGKGTL